MTYPCLVLDHDDTVVNSTATVHYPCFAEYTAKFFPKAKRYTLEEYVLKNFDPGVYDFFHGEVGMTEDDMKHEQAFVGLRASRRHDLRRVALALAEHSARLPRK